MTELFFRVEKLLFYKRHIFCAQFFFACPPLSTLFLFTEFVYGIHLIFFQSSCIESLSLRCFRPSRPWERPHVRARRSSFSPRHPRKAERAFRVRIGRNVWLRMKVEDTQRAKDSVLGFHFSTFILVRFRVLFFCSRENDILAIFHKGEF